MLRPGDHPDSTRSPPGILSEPNRKPAGADPEPTRSRPGTVPEPNRKAPGADLIV
jgi:hypothetical protein